jgi:hypothetical protein
MEAEVRQIGVGVILVTPKRNIFTIVLGLRDGCILTYDGLDGQLPYFVSIGDPRKDLSLVSYCYLGEQSELPASHVISEELGVNALLDSIANEKPSSLIEWFGG